MNTKLKRVLTAIIAATMAFSLTAVGMADAGIGDSAAFISEVSQGEYALFVDNGECQLYRDGQLVRADEMKTSKITLFESVAGGIAVQFVKLDGKRVRITLGDQLHLAIGGAVDSLTISSDVPPSAVIDIEAGARIRIMRVESRAKVNIKDGAMVTTLYVTDRRANVLVENGATVNKVFTVSRSAVSGVSSKDFYVIRDNRWDDDDDDDDDRKSKDKDQDKDKDSGSSSGAPSNSDPQTVSTSQQLEDAIAAGKTNIVLAPGATVDLNNITKDTVRITVSNGATLNLDKANAIGVRIDVQSGGKMSGYQNIGFNNTVTAEKGAELFWTDNSGNSAGTLVGNGNGLINPSSGSVTIRGQSTAEIYDITINGDATINQSSADGTSSAPLVIDDGKSLIINGRVEVVSSGSGPTLKITMGANGVKGTVTVGTNGQLVVNDPGAVEGGNEITGTIVDSQGNPVTLTQAQLAMLRAGASLEEVLAATAPENETSSEPEPPADPLPTTPEATVLEESRQPESSAPVEPAVPSQPEIPSEDPVSSGPAVTPKPDVPTQDPVTSEPPAEEPETSEPSDTPIPTQEEKTDSVGEVPEPEE